MSEDNFEENLWDSLGDIEKAEVAEKMLEKAYDNSFKIITKELTFDELLDNDMANNVEYTLVMHDVEAGFNKEIIEAMIDWYVESEDYEKCAILHEMIKE